MDLDLPTAVLDAGLAAIRRWPSERARLWVERFVCDAAETPSVVAIVAYGSSVRDAEGSEDVDLLYVHAGEVAFGAAPADVDLRAYASEVLDDRIAAGDEILGWALRLGVPLFEHDGFWSELQDRWVGRLPLPSAAAAEARAARAWDAAAGLAANGDVEAARELERSAVTQQARAQLIRSGVFPLSRPELPEQLASVGAFALAAELSALLAERR